MNELKEFKDWYNSRKNHPCSVDQAYLLIIGLEKQNMEMLELLKRLSQLEHEPDFEIVNYVREYIIDADAIINKIEGE